MNLSLIIKLPHGVIYVRNLLSKHIRFLIKFIVTECVYQAVISSILKLSQNLNSWLATFMYSGLENLYFKVEMNFGFISIKNYLISLIASLRSSLE
jgi:hypothetical protein